MKIEKFEDIISWQKSKKLTKELYKLFENTNDFAFKNQILRASLSIMNNIAEGFERKTNKEFKFFLFVAKGSSGEVRSMLNLALDLNKIDEKSFNRLYNLSMEISKLHSGLIKKL